MLTLALLAMLSGCAGTALPVKKHSDAKAQQAKAASAQAEMEKDIAAGTPSLDFAEKPVVKPAEKPAEQAKPVIPSASSPVKVGSLKPVSKYPLKNGFPVWFTTPVYDGYIGAVGIAPKQPSGGFSAQKKVARMQAQKNLAKQISVLVKSELTVEMTAEEHGIVSSYREKVSSLTREEADQFLTGFKVMDEWMDDSTGEYYMWMVLER
jgi:hypothetical protein